MTGQVHTRPLFGRAQAAQDIVLADVFGQSPHVRLAIVEILKEFNAMAWELAQERTNHTRLAVENAALREALLELWKCSDTVAEDTDEDSVSRVILEPWWTAIEDAQKLLTDPSPAVAEIERLVALGRKMELQEEYRHDDRH